MTAETAARITPGQLGQIGPVNVGVAHVLGMAAGTGPPNLFTTLARHRRLFRPWLRFAGRLMPAGALPRTDSELVILRVAALTNCEYERSHHERLAHQAGLTADQVERAVNGDESGWPPRQAAILAAVDELHTTHDLSDATWGSLQTHLTITELIELPMLVGHYTMLAMALNGLRVQPDPPTAEQPGPISRLVAGVASRRTTPRRDR